MSTTLRLAVANLVTTIEAGVPPTPEYDGAPRWRHVPTVESAEQAARAERVTRRFLLRDQGDFGRAARLQQPSRPQPLIASWTVTILYRVSSSSYEAEIVMREDADYLANRIGHPVTWDAVSGLIQRSVTAAAVTPGEGQGATAQLTLTVRMEYTETFTL